MAGFINAIQSRVVFDTLRRVEICCEPGPITRMMYLGIETGLLPGETKSSKLATLLCLQQLQDVNVGLDIRVLYEGRDLLQAYRHTPVDKSCF
jgi:hypothetical protein